MPAGGSCLCPSAAPWSQLVQSPPVCPQPWPCCRAAASAPAPRARESVSQGACVRASEPSGGALAPSCLRLARARSPLVCAGCSGDSSSCRLCPGVGARCGAGTPHPSQGTLVAEMSLPALDQLRWAHRPPPLCPCRSPRGSSSGPWPSETVQPVPRGPPWRWLHDSAVTSIWSWEEAAQRGSLLPRPPDLDALVVPPFPSFFSTRGIFNF